MEEMDNPIKGSSSSEQSLSYNDIASKLLKDRLLLTALELHSELIECGKEIPRLKEFFSNPGNFEDQFSRPEYSAIARSSSQATLDSLDMTRLSEDGERGADERVAVLEFELRKAKETITALRANLTVATECETPTADKGMCAVVNEPVPIKPHEQRALNFLINEHLLRHNYKLTSITFADENEDQDFEDWDDVGLNIPKPAELLQLYRDAMKQPAHGFQTEHFSCQVSLPTDQERSYMQDISSLNVELDQLRSQISLLEQEKAELSSEIERLSSVEVQTHFAPETVSTRSATPERFELIHAEREVRTEDSGSLNEQEWTRVNHTCTDSETGSVTERGDSNGSSKGGGRECMNEERQEPMGAEADTLPVDSTPSIANNRSLPQGFQKEVLCRCFVNTSKVGDAALLAELLTEGISLQRLIHILALTLPKVLPNIASNKREELIPLLVCTIHLHNDPSHRDTLLQLLFSLKKRPQEEERRCILAGLVSLARVSSQAVIESELLPHFWEAISNKQTEFKLLVSEGCSALTPYISPGLRNSLLLSILQQLLDDKEEDVRVSSVRSLALLVAVMADTDKYSQIEELTVSAVLDSSAAVSETATQTLLPVLAQWALHLQCLQDRLLTKLLNTLLSTLQETNVVKQAVSTRVVLVLKSLLPQLVMSVVSEEFVTQRIQPDLPLAESRGGFAECCQGLNNPTLFYDGEFSVGSVISAFDLVVKEDVRWPKLSWVLDSLLPKMLDCLECAEVTNEELLNSFIAFFKSLAAGFGKTVTVNMVKPVFLDRLRTLESKLTNLSDVWPNLSLIPVFLLAIEAPIQSEAEEVGATLQRFLFSLSLSGAPVDCLQVSVAHLCRLPALHETIMAALWEGVVHPRPAVRAVTAQLFGVCVSLVGESMTTNRIVPALITFASDPEVIVKTATIPVFGTLIEFSTNKEVEDKTYFQLQSLLSDPVARDSHQTLLQLVTTLGYVVAKCDQWFRDDVIVPQLAATAAYTLQLTNQSRRTDLASALVEAFNNVVYCSLTKNTITTALLPGLRYLEQVCSLSLVHHHETVLSMIQEVESRSEPVKPMERSSSSIALATSQGVEDMKNRVTKMFQTPISRPTNLPNLQSINIFRKK